MKSISRSTAAARGRKKAGPADRRRGRRLRDETQSAATRRGAGSRIGSDTSCAGASSRGQMRQKMHWAWEWSRFAGPRSPDRMSRARRRLATAPARRRQRRPRLGDADERLEQQPRRCEHGERALQPADLRPRRSHGSLETGEAATVKAEMSHAAGSASKSHDCHGAATVRAAPPPALALSDRTESVQIDQIHSKKAKLAPSNGIG